MDEKGSQVLDSSFMVELRSPQLMQKHWSVEAGIQQIEAKENYQVIIHIFLVPLTT